MEKYKIEKIEYMHTIKAYFELYTEFNYCFLGCYVTCSPIMDWNKKILKNIATLLLQIN